MRYMRYFIMVLLLLLLPINRGTSALTINIGFSTEALSADERNILLSNIKISMLSIEPPKKAVECFDVNESGLIAIGSNTYDNKIISIYTSNGIFQYGYSFKCSGKFGVEWSKDCLIIYLVRSDVAIVVDSMGEVKDVLKIQNTIENNSYWNHFVFSTKRNNIDTVYTLRNDMGFFNIFASSYSQVVATKTNGEEVIIYDVNQDQFLNMLLIFIVVIVFILIVIFYLIRLLIRTKYNI